MSRELANASAKDRPTTDFYPTPPEATRALMQFLKLPPQTKIWEPSCGAGHMSREIEAFGHSVFSSDLHDHGFGAVGLDFLEAELPEGVTFAITNPPFNVSAEFIARMASMGGLEGFALLLKSQYWHSAKRRALFEQYPPAYVLPLTWRPDFHFGSKGGSPTMEVLWTVWLRPFEANSPARYIPLAKP
jgi:hypothetical protein